MMIMSLTKKFCSKIDPSLIYDEPFFCFWSFSPFVALSFYPLHMPKFFSSSRSSFFVTGESRGTGWSTSSFVDFSVCSVQAPKLLRCALCERERVFQKPQRCHALRLALAVRCSTRSIFVEIGLRCFNARAATRFMLGSFFV